MVLTSGIKKEEVIPFTDTELKQETRTSELIQISRQNPYLQRWSLPIQLKISFPENAAPSILNFLNEPLIFIPKDKYTQK